LDKSDGEKEMVQSLTAFIAKDIKQRIWDGVPQSYIAEEFSITQATVSRITNGHQWIEVPWPNGSRGALPIERKMFILKRRLEGAQPMRVASAPEPQVELSDIAIEAADLIAQEEEREYRKRDEELALAPYEVPSRKRAEITTDLSFNPSIWKKFLELVPDNRFVKEAEESGDTLQKRAIIHTFSALPDTLWDSGMMDRYIAAARAELKKQEE
jgi:hypothetical protein